MEFAGRGEEYAQIHQQTGHPRIAEGVGASTESPAGQQVVPEMLLDCLSETNAPFPARVSIQVT